jgi:eukaryotic-like serine/threonine-protein kinase
MNAALPEHDLVAVLRPGRTFLFRNRATASQVILKRVSAGASGRLVLLGPLASRWGLVSPEGVPHLVRPFVAGRTLTELLGEGPLAADRVAALVRAFAAALSPLHSRGIAHGELHPNNVIETEGGRIVLVDGLEPFCGAADAGDPQAALEALYAAPEVVRGAHATPRADVWSLGVMTHRLLAGAHPFEASDFAATMARILYEAPLGIAVARPDLPAALAAAVDRAHTRSPRARLRTAMAFAEALGEPPLSLVAAESPPALEAGVASASNATPAPAPAPALGAPPATASAALARGRGWLVGATFVNAWRAGRERLRAAPVGPRVALVAAPVLAIALLWLGGEDPLVREVRQLLAAGELPRAADVLDRAAAQRPTDPAVEKLRGDLACARGHGRECLRRYRAAIEARPGLKDDPLVRENVLALLGREDVRALAVRLATWVDGVDELLLERTRSDRYWTRWNAVRALEARGEAERIDYADVYARDLLHGGSCATRRAAAAKLAELRDPRTLPALEQARASAGAFDWFCTGDTIGRAIASVRSRDEG